MAQFYDRSTYFHSFLLCIQDRSFGRRERSFRLGDLFFLAFGEATLAKMPKISHPDNREMCEASAKMAN